MKKIFIILMALVFYTFSYAQSIRKNYREFTQKEMNDYVAALNILFDDGVIDHLAEHHSEHFNSVIHTTSGFNGEQFLSWHRFFMLDFEQQLKKTNSNYNYLNLPYWDWTTDQNKDDAKFWSKDFLILTKLPGWGITRNIGLGGGFLGNTTDINNTLNLTPLFNNATISTSSSNDFSHRLEYYHNNVHVWVGGTMGGGTSPRDPVFYLHHNQVDRLWQQWEDKNTGIQTGLTLSNPNNPLIFYGNVTSTQVLDSRKLPRPSSAGAGRLMDVWYAKNKKVVLDGANGASFIASDVAAPYLYAYTAAISPGSSTVKGEIHVGDLQRDANDNIIADNKGGFKVNNMVKCNFKAGASISFLPGFTAEYGSITEAKIVTTPNAANFNNPPDDFVNGKSFAKTEKVSDKPFALVLEPDFSIYPNPNDGIFTISTKNINNGMIEIYNSSGVKIYKTDIRTSTVNYRVNLSGNPAGVYIITVSSKGKQKITKKIIIQ